MPKLRSVFPALVGLAAVWLAVLPRPPIDNTIETLLAPDDERAQVYRSFQNDFGSDQIVVVHVQGERMLDVLRHAKVLHQVLESSDAIESVLSPHQAYPDLTAALEDPDAQDLVDRETADRLLQGPLARRLQLLHLSPPRATLLGLGPPTPPPPRQRLQDALQRVRSRAQADDVQMAWAGPPFLNLALDSAGRRVEAVALPVLAAISVLFLLIVLRSGWHTIIVLLPVGLGVANADGLLSLLGQSTNLLVNVVKPLVFVLLLASGLHLLVVYDAQRRLGVRPKDAAKTAVQEKGRAITLALLTTALGFGSLAFSKLGPIRTFGGLSAAALLWGIPLILGGLPWLLTHLDRRPPRKPPHPLTRPVTALVKSGLRHRRWAILAGLSILASGAWTIPRLVSEPHAIRYFAPEHPLRKDHEALKAAGFGLSTLELTVTSSLALTHQKPLKTLGNFMDDAETQPGVHAALGLPTFLREAGYRQSGRPIIPDPLTVENFLQEKSQALAPWIKPSQRRLRIALTLGDLDAEQLDRLRENLQRSFSAKLGRHANLDITGSYPLLMGAQQALLDTLQTSLILSAVLMTLILIFALRSIRLAMIALIPNLIPVVGNMTLMYLGHIPIDIGTSMTAAVALGIAVDDTLHFILGWKRHGAVETARITGTAIWMSSMVIAAGFFSLLLSDFRPTRTFGILTGAAMLTALLADLWVLPALLGPGQAGNTSERNDTI